MTIQHDPIIQNIERMVAKGALFFCGHSGGKDSQAMYALLKQYVPAHQLIAIHADLGDIEWAGVKDHIRANIDGNLHIAKAEHKDGSPADFFTLVRRQVATHIRQVNVLNREIAKMEALTWKMNPLEVERYEKLLAKRDAKLSAPPWPSSSARFCTSDLKTGPIWREIRRISEERGATIVINCVGIRAMESGSRSKKIAKRPENQMTVNKKNTNGKRDAYDFWPLAHWTCTTDRDYVPGTGAPEVFAYIAQAGQTPHPAYAEGNDRLSCMFCIFGSVNDLSHAAQVRPDLAQQYINLEDETGYTMFNGQSLADRIIVRSS